MPALSLYAGPVDRCPYCKADAHVVTCRGRTRIYDWETGGYHVCQKFRDGTVFVAPVPPKAAPRRPTAIKPIAVLHGITLPE